MNQPITAKENRQRPWYIIYAAVLAVVFLYAMFPSDALTDYIKGQAVKKYPDIDISFEKIGLSMSPGIILQGLKIALRENPDTPVYVSEKSSIRFSIIDWLKGDTKYYFKSNIKDGEISGFLEEKNDVKKDRIDASIDLKNINLDENNFIHPLFSKRLEGTLTGKITFIGDPADPFRGNTDIALELTDGRFKLLEPVLDFKTVEFKNTSLHGVLDNRRLNIKDLNLAGELINGNATGTVQIGNNLLSSRLNLRAEIEPSPSLLQKIPDIGKDIINNKMKDGKIRIDFQGTIERPSYKFR